MARRGGEEPPRPPLRTIAIGVADAHPLVASALELAASQARDLATAYRDAGYEVQTIRLSTRPVFEDLADRSPAAIGSYVIELQRLLGEVAPDLILSVGPAPAHRPDFELDRLSVLAEALIGAPSIFASVQIATQAEGIRAEAARPCAEIVLQLSRETDEGFGAFRFAMLAGMEPGSPFFPAGYHRGPAMASVGWQGAGVVARAAVEAQGKTSLASLTERIREAVTAAGRPIVEAGQKAAATLGLHFGGLDVSPAPAGADSIGAAIESCGLGTFGSPGTVAVAGALTAALKTVDIATCGYSGLMLPVMEDDVIAERWAAREVGQDQLLTYSAICGTGLDAVPLPGDIEADELMRMFLDVATLAVRVGKPLSARFMPVPGKRQGDLTTFTSPHVVNTRI